MSHSPAQTRVLIVGGGVAALEAALALRDLAGDAVSVTLLTPSREFVYRPMTVREPFAYPRANRYPLEEIADDIGVELTGDTLTSLDAPERVVHTEAGHMLQYDVLLLALGAKLQPRFEHAVTLDDRHLDEQLHGLIQDLEQGFIHRLALISPMPMPWPLPIYELALMTARRAYDMGVDLSITIATPEDAPLAIFGAEASDTVGQLLEEHGILTITSAHCEVPAPGRVTVRPGDRELHVDRIVALPQLLGPSIPGLPEAADGFIAVDERCMVRSLEHVYAAGDATDFPIKLGGIAAQQADTVAREIAQLAGIPVEAPPFDPEIHAILIGGEEPLYLSARVTGGHGLTSQVTRTAIWSPPSKIAARYLAPYLEQRERVARSRS